MDHAPYILAAYAATGLVILAMILWVVLDGRARTRDLAVLDAAGHPRRSRAAEKEQSA